MLPRTPRTLAGIFAFSLGTANVVAASVFFSRLGGWTRQPSVRVQRGSAGRPLYGTDDERKKISRVVRSGQTRLGFVPRLNIVRCTHSTSDATTFISFWMPFHGRNPPRGHLVGQFFRRSNCKKICVRAHENVSRSPTRLTQNSSKTATPCRVRWVIVFWRERQRSLACLNGLPNTSWCVMG